jgi:hypothetical protein
MTWKTDENEFTQEPRVLYLLDEQGERRLALDVDLVRPEECASLFGNVGWDAGADCGNA